MFIPSVLVTVRDVNKRKSRAKFIHPIQIRESFSKITNKFTIKIATAFAVAFFIVISMVVSISKDK